MVRVGLTLAALALFSVTSFGQIVNPGGGGGGGATIPATTSVLKGDGAGNGAAAVAGVDYGIPVIPIARFISAGDSYDKGWGATRIGTTDQASIIANATPGPFQQISSGGTFASQIAASILASVQTDPTLPSAMLLDGGNNDYTNCPSGSGSIASCIQNYKAMMVTSELWGVSTPTYRLLASTSASTGTWAADTTLPLATGPGGGSYGTAMTSSTSGSTRTWTIPAGNSGWFALIDRRTTTGTGTFTLTATPSGGSAVNLTDNYSGSTTFTSGGYGAVVFPGLTSGPFANYYPITAGTQYSVVLTTTNAAAVSPIAVIYMPSTLPANAGHLFVEDSSPVYDINGNYSTAQAQIITSLSTLGTGLPITLVPIRAATLPCAFNAAQSATCAATTLANHPSDQIYQTYASIFFAAEKTAGFVFSNVNAGSKQPATDGKFLAPINVGLDASGQTTMNNMMSNMNLNGVIGGGICLSQNCNIGIRFGQHTMGTTAAAQGDSTSYFGMDLFSTTTARIICRSLSDGSGLAANANFTSKECFNASTGNMYLDGAYAAQQFIAARYSLGSATNVDSGGTITMTGGTGTYTFTGTYTNAPICTANDTTAIAAVRVSATNTVLTLSGTSGDVANFNCFYRP